MRKCTPFEETHFVTSSGAENNLKVYVTFVDQKRQMLILLSLRLKQTYSYVDCKRDMLKISAGGPLY